MDRRTLAFLGAGLAITLVVAGGLSLMASDQPDGLERVSIDEDFADQADEHALQGAPLADYEVGGGGDGWGTALAGIIGVGITLVITVGLLWLTRRAKRSPG
jgi:hypothetical protein